MAKETVAATEIRRGLADILIRIHRGEVIEVTQNGRRVAVMMPPDLADQALKLINSAQPNS